ncbi:hypothetical protein COF37_13100 [Bacillus wiedmannii]|uniref:hypothetical protein n=1 Tax=Bacillus wiedmannii TaxID=1890302 RepID=UPI000BFD6809|nr:hypothetical protein [Bacillus wiedmannii]PHD24376.1 hypothetical protein COF37_13100 [Bacillus wiedmannii]
MRYLLNDLKLVYPPISNQGAFWLRKDKDVREIISSSNLYMIGQRKQLYFVNIDTQEIEQGVITFNLKMGNIISPLIRYSIYDELKELDNEGDKIGIELGEQLFRFTLNTQENVICWFTPDSFLYLLSRKEINVFITEEFDFSQFWKFKLHYVGISKTRDSFYRLFDQGHTARADILSNEKSIEESANLSDELTIFFFEIEKYNFNIFLNEGEVEKDLNYYSDKIRVISDAEKAFVKLLKPKYNKILFDQYPKSDDGLCKDNIFRFGYSIKEDLTFYTNTDQFIGNYDLEKASDLIIIENNEVELIKPDANNGYSITPE